MKKRFDEGKAGNPTYPDDILPEYDFSQAASTGIPPGTPPGVLWWCRSLTWLPRSRALKRQIRRCAPWQELLRNIEADVRHRAAEFRHKCNFYTGFARYESAYLRSLAGQGR